MFVLPSFALICSKKSLFIVAFCVFLNPLPSAAYTFINLKSQGIIYNQSLDFLKKQPPSDVYFYGIGDFYIYQQFYATNFRVLKTHNYKRNEARDCSNYAFYRGELNFGVPKNESLIIVNMNSILPTNEIRLNLKEPNYNKITQQNAQNKPCFDYLKNKNIISTPKVPTKIISKNDLELLFQTHVFGIPRVTLVSILAYFGLIIDIENDKNPFRLPINNEIYALKTAL